MAKGKAKGGEPARRLDDLRRLAGELGAAAGLPRDRAAALAGYLLWFDEAGAHDLGIARLPEWLDRCDRGEFHEEGDGIVGRERGGTASLDGQGGLPPWVLGRASRIAAEKAREVGVGVVVVSGIAAMGPATPFAADLAIGPQIGLAIGPDGDWSLAWPSPEGLPVVLDARLGGRPTGQGPPPLPFPLISPAGGWLIAALAVSALEPLTEFHRKVATGPDVERVAALEPEAWEASRRALREAGLRLPGEVARVLQARAEAAAIPFDGVAGR